MKQWLLCALETYTAIHWQFIRVVASGARIGQDQRFFFVPSYLSEFFQLMDYLDTPASTLWPSFRPAFARLLCAIAYTYTCAKFSGALDWFDTGIFPDRPVATCRGPAICVCDHMAVFGLNLSTANPPAWLEVPTWFWVALKHKMHLLHVFESGVQASERDLDDLYEHLAQRASTLNQDPDVDAAAPGLRGDLETDIDDVSRSSRRQGHQSEFEG
jgi:hypothetical protein